MKVSVDSVRTLTIHDLTEEEFSVILACLKIPSLGTEYGYIAERMEKRLTKSAHNADGAINLKVLFPIDAFGDVGTLTLVDNFKDTGDIS